MIGLLLVTHPNLGSALIETIEFISGKKEENLSAVSVDIREYPDKLRKRIQKELSEIKTEQGAIILTDMFGGTPSNLSYSFLEEGHIEVISGVNLPILFKAVKRTPLIAGNWKMYKTGHEAVITAKALVLLCSDVREVEVMIAPTFLSLPLVADSVKGTNVSAGAQNLYFEKEGAFTGEVSGSMIKAAGAEYVIIGHSERRQYFGETDTNVCKKIKAALEADLKPVLCIGETEQEREEEKTFFTLDKQVSDGLKGFRSDELRSLVLAYEPVWAIGTGKTASTAQVDEVHKYLRSRLKQMFSQDFADRTRILYGGSVKPENVKELMALQDVDGALVGGASLAPDKFIKIIKYYL
jgi:triosephosphate isomerase (TIM)